MRSRHALIGRFRAAAPLSTRALDSADPLPIRSSRSVLRLRSLAALTLVVSVAAGCGDDSTDTESGENDTSTTVAETTTTAKPSDLTDLTVKPIIEKPSGDPPNELVKEDIVVGTGPEATAGSLVDVDYVGNSWSTGKEFDNSWDRGAPFSLTLGAGSVISGWDQGIVGMKVGGRRKLVIPPDLAYGEQSPSPDIGPNETLVFIVDLRYAGTKPTVDLAGVVDTGSLQTKDLVVGTGEAVTETSTVRAQMVGYLLAGAKEFFSSWEAGQEPASFSLGSGALIPGVEQGLVGMKAGGRRMIVVPASMGYGASGAGDGAIPPNAALVYVVDLLGVTAAPAGEPSGVGG
jgi:peptidylprolyl isomerase